MKKPYLIILLITASCLLAGCNSYWYQQGTSFEQCRQDRQDCLNELKKYYDFDSFGKTVSKAEREFMYNCMIEKGYTLVKESEIPPRTKRQDPDRTTYWFSNGIAGTVD
ncbi:MAG: hypothetical protein ACYTEE_03180 [Planctomycetota bacterium]|jgi:hypothetical protein